MAGRLIALLTDYGYKDPYAGVMKGVIKAINPEAEIVDLTHGISRQDVLEGALALLAARGYFPAGTIFVAVVDPGVGGRRRAVVVETTNYYLVGPDNGVLSLLAEADGIRRAFDVSNSRYRLPAVSGTFHGRDVFAPIAAWISRGVRPEELGVEVDPSSLARLDIGNAEVEGGALRGAIIYVDAYGNLMTNIPARLAKSAGIEVGDQLFVRLQDGRRFECSFVESFSWVRPGELACYENSWGYVELAIFMGNAAEALGLGRGARVEIRRAGKKSPDDEDGRGGVGG
ncbi:MAG: S-adenosyl-l-methionine hydroxide adenosyltransferase family protein [Desulfurococcaceae archaeon]